MSKKKQKKSGTSKKRSKPGRSSAAGAGAGRSAGIMTNMISGFRRAVGTDETGTARVAKKSNPVWTVVLIAAALAVLFWNFTR